MAKKDFDFDAALNDIFEEQPEMPDEVKVHDIKEVSSEPEIDPIVEAKKKAEEKAKEKAKAEAERKKKEAEARKKAEEEARKKAKAEEEAKKQEEAMAETKKKPIKKPSGTLIVKASSGSNTSLYIDCSGTVKNLKGKNCKISLHCDSLKTKDWSAKYIPTRVNDDYWKNFKMSEEQLKKISNFSLMCYVSLSYDEDGADKLLATSVVDVDVQRKNHIFRADEYIILKVTEVKTDYFKD